MAYKTMIIRVDKWLTGWTHISGEENIMAKGKCPGGKIRSGGKGKGQGHGGGKGPIGKPKK